MDRQKIISLIKDYPDFPIKGVTFKEIGPVLADASAFNYVIDEMSKLIPVGTDALIGVDARGFIFASAIAYKLNIGMIMARKKGKLPGELLEASFSYEYSEATLNVSKEMLKPNMKAVIVDDVLATGNTLSALYNVLVEENVNISKVICFLEIDFLKGREKFAEKYRENVISLLHI